MNYNDYIDTFQIALDDGYFIRSEFSGSQWDLISPSLTDYGKNNLTENQIRNWFIGHGFGNTEANQVTSWLLTIDHGIIFSRT